MFPVCSTLYAAIVRFAEGNVRITRAYLPTKLFEEYAADPEGCTLMLQMGVRVDVDPKLNEPRFFGETK